VQFGIILSFMVVKSSLEKTLTNSDDLADRPHRIRTCDVLLEAQGLWGVRGF
jgi:hypothetical protein